MVIAANWEVESLTDKANELTGIVAILQRIVRWV